MSDKTKFIVTGGLGNQLFISAAAKFFEVKTNKKVVLDFSFKKYNFTNHKSDVRNLNLKTGLHHSDKYYEPLLFRFHNSLNKISKTPIVYNSKSVGFDNNLINQLNARYILGHFQTFRYLENEIVASAYQMIMNSPRNSMKKHLYDLEPEKAIGVHIRRGDYKLVKNSHGLLAYDYYEAAFNILHENVDLMQQINKIIVFSDDFIGAKNLISKIKTQIPIYFLDPKDVSPEETLILASRMAGLIIANSTYSWWCAYLNNHDKVVVAPSKWFKNMKDPQELIPASWITVDSKWVS